VKCRFIKDLVTTYPVRLLCRVMQVSHSAYYAWRKRPAQIITANEVHLYRRMKELFSESGSLGSRMMLKQLRKEGFKLGRYRVRGLMKRLKLMGDSTPCLQNHYRKKTQPWRGG